MPKYSISYDVVKAEGTVIYTVEAETRSEAVEKLKNGHGDITYYEVEPGFSSVDYEKEVYEDSNAILIEEQKRADHD